MERPILNLEEVELVEQAAGERFRGWLGVIGGRIGAAPGGPKEQRTVSFFGRLSDARDYWEGET